MEFVVNFRGHENVRLTHRTTIEITRENDLTVAGDCIAGVGAQCGCRGLPEKLKAHLQRTGSTVEIEVRAGGETFCMRAHGSPNLTLQHENDIVIRKSDFECPRTLAVGCDYASESVPRSMVQALQDPKCLAQLAIRVV